VSAGACGAQKGVVARGWASWPRIPVTCASARALVHGRRGEGGADRGGPRCRERGRARGGNGSTTGKTGPQGRERRGARGRRNRRRQPGPTGQREGERVRGGGSCRLQVEPTCQAARARGLARPSWAGWATLPFSFFLNFLIAFLFLFSRVFNSNSNQVLNSK
jgi:hypothetical protein